jgi:hypothetical protein
MRLDAGAAVVDEGSIALLETDYLGDVDGGDH